MAGKVAQEGRPGPAVTGGDLSEAAPRRRPYDSPVRRQRTAQTRERIIAAGAQLLHGRPIWDWHALTIRAVAERAGVNARTVYRHFATERDLRDAVLHRLQEEAGIEIERLRLEDIADLTARMFAYVSAFPIAPRTPRDATMAEANRRQRQALITAVAESTPSWSDTDRAITAAMFDVLWSVVSYERLATDWELRPKEAIRGVTWVIGMLENAVRDGRRPPS